LHGSYFASLAQLDFAQEASQNKPPSSSLNSQVKICFATIVSPNYLAYARVLGESLARHAPEADFRVLIVGRADPLVVAAVKTANLKATYADELGLPDFEQLAYKFDIVELNTALKPTFLKALFALGFDKVVYLDPDISLYAAPTPVMDALDTGEIALIPHALAPVMDGMRPSDIDFMRAGSFNLGFIGLRRGSQAFALLDWWERRCLSHGFNDPGFGTFVDQKWLDLAPSYFDSVLVLKHPGCNVAYWNLHERTVGFTDGQYQVNGRPLIFFHFSGVDASAPMTLSRHQNRHSLVAGTALADLVRDYCERLLAAGHTQWSGLPYSFGSLEDGTPVTPVMRRAACVETMGAAQPFNPDAPLQRALRMAGVTPRAGAGASKAATTLTFDPTDRRVVLVNRLIRLCARVVGANRLLLLLRYVNFLGWQSNFAAVLLDKPVNLEHRDVR
jgi:hypothetical protein